MKISDFIDEWTALQTDTSTSTLDADQRIRLFSKWTSLRLAIANQKGKNKFWRDFIMAGFKVVKSSFEKQLKELPADDPVASTLTEILEGLDKAMAEHRKEYPDG